MTGEFGCFPATVPNNQISKTLAAFSLPFHSYYFTHSNTRNPSPSFFLVDFLFSGSEWVLPLFPMLSLSFNQSHFLISHLITQVLPGPQPPSELASAGAALTKWHQSMCTLNWSCLPDGGLLIPSTSESTVSWFAHVTEAQDRRQLLPL